VETKLLLSLMLPTKTLLQMLPRLLLQLQQGQASKASSREKARRRSS
jgi:hypothetical protein